MRDLTLLVIPDILFQIVRDKLLDLGRLESPSRDLLLEQDVEFSVRSAPARVSTLPRRYDSPGLWQSEQAVQEGQGGGPGVD
jgi:hypothetical protein